jgi:thiamine-phosphate pyrophosphorylase
VLQIPVLALGGIKTENIQEVMAVGASGIAMVSAVIASEDPKAEAEAMFAMLSASCSREL